MALSKEEKEALAEHYRGKDLYDPSKAPEQEVYTFKPKSEPVKLSDGVEVASDFDGPGISGDTTTAMGAEPDSGPMVFDAPGLKDALVNKVNPPAMAPKQPTMAQGASLPAKAPSINPSVNSFDANGGVEGAYLDALGDQAVEDEQAKHAASPVKSLQPDEYSQLVKALSARPSLGQSAMSGLAGLADAISTGVARSANPGFQRNIMETQQNQKRNLIDALNAKYGHNLELAKMDAENKRAANSLAGENERAEKAQAGETSRSKSQIAAEGARTAAELGVRAKEAEAARAQSGIEAAARLPATGLLHPSTWGKGDEIEAVRSQLLNQGQPQGNPAASPVYATPQAQAIKQQYQQGKITKAQANQLLDKLYGSR